jgi:hypothetical protein
MKKKNKTPVFYGLRLWLLICFGAFLILGAVYWLTGRDKNTVRFDAYVSTPTAAHFADDTSAILYDNIPDVNNNRNIIPQSYVQVTYEAESGGTYSPPFNFNNSNATLAQNIKIRPAIRGTWAMLSPYMLRFTPEHNWPANTRFDVKIDGRLFASDARPNTKTISFTTAPVSAHTDTFNIYPVPGNDKSVVGVAVISFNYPISTKDFSDKVSMRLDGKNINFSVKFDRYMRTAIIQTAPIKITDDTQTLRLKLNRVPDADGRSRTEKITAKTIINSLDTFFKVLDVKSITANDKTGNPQQLILLNMSAAAKSKTDWQKYVSAYLLPLHAKNNSDEDSHNWTLDEVTPQVIKQSQKLDLKLVDFVNPAGTYQYAFAYAVSDALPRYIYTVIAPGIGSENGFVSKNGLNSVLPVAYPERSVKIAGKGALLSLAGDKTLGIVAQGGVDTAYVNLYKIESTEINHLITQTYNLFSDLEFRVPWAFDAYDMAVVFKKKIPFANTSMNRVNYASLNLGEYLDRTYQDKTGIFIIKTGTTESEAEYSDARLVLLTNLGIIRKINLNGSSSVFISQISSGAPAPDVDVTVLGRNGQAIWAGVSDAGGRVDIPYFAYDEYKNEKQPVAIVARQNSDISFIPYSADSAQTNDHSKFEVGGVYASFATPLQGFVFSDRGIYRNGETVTIGAIVENKNFTSVAETPIKIEITDPRGRTVVDKKISLNATGMFDVKYKLTGGAPLGEYNVTLYSLNKRGHVQDSIGGTTFTVQDFIPDTMKIMANLATENHEGWVSTNNISLNVALNNLYGTPATNRRVTAVAYLRPTDFKLPQYAGYTFAQNVKADSAKQLARNLETFVTEIGDVRTDENGNAQINIEFDREIPKGTYMLNINVNGFDASDGKSVQTAVNSRASNLKYLVGYKAESDISYVQRNDTKKVQLIAIDENATPIDLPDLTLRLVRRENLTSLIKDTNNQYKYQTVSRDAVIKESLISISRSGSEITLDTSTGGTYYMQLTDTDGTILTNLEYFVAANENVDLSATNAAELKVKLDAAEYKPGDTIKMGIIAPYTGTGLITIERDKVYAHKWFVAKTTSSTQQITVPADFEGTGYVNVSFVRDINSRDVFTNPYTYAVAPFSTKIDKHKIKTTLNVPDIVRDNKLKVEYTTNQDSDSMVFAINTGILQVAKHKIPNPLKHFFQKAALQVETNQILSLLLPEYKILREVAKTGGGDFSDEFGGIDTPLTNPFARSNLPPIAFYSGIIKTTANKPQEITFDIPEYFNGELTVYAVAANTGAVGGTDTASKIQSPVIISISAPTFVAPNDEFVVNTIVSNLAPKSGHDASVQVGAKTGGQLLSLDNISVNMPLPENTEKLWSFNATAKPEPGTANINVSAKLFDAKDKQILDRSANTELSIRPATTAQTNIQTKVINDVNTQMRLGTDDMFAEKLTRNLFIAKTPTILARPLVSYLENYDYSCTEQIVSRTLPYVLMSDNKLIGTNYQNSLEKISKTVQVLISRQNTDGSFGTWAAGSEYSDNINDARTAYLTAYVMNFLSLARQNGFSVPQSMFARGIDYLRDFAGQTTTNFDNALAKALAIYTLTQNDYVTTSYIDALQEYAKANIKNWESGIIGPYLAASYKMLKQTDKAAELIAKYHSGNQAKTSTNQFDTGVANDAWYAFILRRYFNTGDDKFFKIIENYINAGKYDSFTAAAIIAALATTSENAATALDDVSIFANDKKLKIAQESEFIHAVVPQNATKLRINCKTCDQNNILFATFVQQGFPKKLATTSNGIEISRRYYDANGNEINSGKIGDIIDVKIVARTRGGTEQIDNAVISDLLPGGFIPLGDSLTGDKKFAEIREDRILIYTGLSRVPSVFTYRVQMSNAGRFTIPQISASDMYNAAINATGTSGTFTVSNEAD